MAREPKFTFISEDVIGRKPKFDGIDYRVSLHVWCKKDETGKEVTKQVQVVFPGEVLKIYDLEGKRIKFYLDQARKAIAWRVIDGDTTLDELNKARICKIQKNGVWAASVVKLVNAGGFEVKESRRGIPVKTYKSQDMLMPLTFSYIEL